VRPPPQRIFAHTWLSGAVHGSHNAVSRPMPLPHMALFGPDRPGWRRLFLRVKRTSQLRAPKSENDPSEHGSGHGNLVRRFNRGMSADDLNERAHDRIVAEGRRELFFLHPRDPPLVLSLSDARIGFCPKSALYFPSSSLALVKTAMGSVSSWAEIRRPPHSVDGKLDRRRRRIPRRTPSKLIHTTLVRDYPRKR